MLKLIAKSSHESFLKLTLKPSLFRSTQMIQGIGNFKTIRAQETLFLM